MDFSEAGGAAQYADFLAGVRDDQYSADWRDDETLVTDLASDLWDKHANYKPAMSNY